MCAMITSPSSPEAQEGTAKFFSWEKITSVQLQSSPASSIHFLHARSGRRRILDDEGIPQKHFFFSARVKIVFERRKRVSLSLGFPVSRSEVVTISFHEMNTHKLLKRRWRPPTHVTLETKLTLWNTCRMNEWREEREKGNRRTNVTEREREREKERGKSGRETTPLCEQKGGRGRMERFPLYSPSRSPDGNEQPPSSFYFPARREKRHICDGSGRHRRT